MTYLDPIVYGWNIIFIINHRGPNTQIYFKTWKTISQKHLKRTLGWWLNILHKYHKINLQINNNKFTLRCTNIYTEIFTVNTKEENCKHS